MNQLRHLLPLAIIASACLTPKALAGSLLIDDFESYSSGSYIQTQGDKLWSRFGTAIADGIYSVADGSDDGRAARVMANYNPGGTVVNAYTRYTFATAVDYSDYSGFSLEIKVNTPLQGTQIYAQISSDGGTPTVFETLTPIEFIGTDYATYTFTFTDETVRTIQGSLTVAEVMADLKSVVFRFHNGTTTGSQAFTFDGFAAIPEPGTVALLAFSGAGAAFFMIRRRYRSL